MLAVLILGVAFPSTSSSTRSPAFRLGDGTAKLFGPPDARPVAPLRPVGGWMLVSLDAVQFGHPAGPKPTPVQPDEPPRAGTATLSSRRPDRSRTSCSRSLFAIPFRILSRPALPDGFAIVFTILNFIVFYTSCSGSST